jgi:tetratricopeptide (TPR) repeat protein
LEHALTYLEESLELARPLGNRYLLGEVLLFLARVEADLGRLDRMLAHAIECVNIGRETNAVLLAASVFLGMFEPPDRRQALLEEFLAAALKIGSVNVGYAFQLLAEFALENGDLHRAGQLFAESYQHYRQHGDRGGPAAVSTGLGRILLLQGDYSQAISLFEKSRNLWHVSGWERYSAFSTRMLGRVAWYQGDYETAARRYQECFEILQRCSNRDEMAVTSIYQALLLRDQGEYQRAKALCDESLEVIRQVNWRDEIGWALLAKASIVHCLGEPERTVKIYRESLTVLSESSDRILKVTVIEGLGVALASAKDYPRAEGLLAFAESQRNQMGIILPPPEQPYHDEAIKILRQALDEETFAQAWQAGQAMTLEEAVAEALSNEGEKLP